MKAFFATIFTCFALCHSNAQDAIVYPYNPDADNDELVGVTDLLPLLSVFGEDFQPGEIVIDGVALAEVLMTMQQTIESLQTQVEALEASAVVGLNEYMSVDVDAHSVLLTGANFQVVNGEGASATVNGQGNVIIGYNESDTSTSIRGGSHNLVLGRMNQYASFGGLIHGLNNTVLSAEGAVIAGSNNLVSGYRSAVLGGDQNTSSGNKVVSVGGVHNEAKGSVAVVIGGSENVADGTATTIAGGAINQTLGTNTTAVGGGLNTADGYRGVVVGGQSNQTAPSESNYTAVFGGRFNTGGDYCGAILGGYENTIASGINVLPGYGTQTKVIVGGRGNLNVAASHGTILGGEFLTLEPRDTATFYGGEPGFYGPSNDVGIGYPGKVYLGSSNNPEFLLTGDAPEE
jgi:hypothetical protein